MSRFNFVDKAYEKVNVPDDFNISTAFNSPFVIDGVVMVVYSRDLWMFDAVSKTWSVRKNGIKSGSAFGDDVFIIDGKPYLIYEGNVIVFEPAI